MPYPEHDNIQAHEDFYKKYSDEPGWINGEYYDVKSHDIKYSIDGNIQTRRFDCSMCVKDDVYYLRLKYKAEYKYNKETERWEKVKDLIDERKVNLTAVDTNGNDNSKWYIPGPGQEDFYKNFKTAIDDGYMRFADGMTIFKRNNNQWENYINDNSKNWQEAFWYYVSNGRYCVSIWTPNWIHLKYNCFYYDDEQKEWIGYAYYRFN